MLASRGMSVIAWSGGGGVGGRGGRERGGGRGVEGVREWSERGEGAGESSKEIKG